MLIDQRKQLVHQFGLNWLKDDAMVITNVADDASFRRYFRLQSQGKSWIVMDAPPDKENCTTFIEITQRLRDAGLHAPEILQADLNNGLLLLEDLGDTQFKPLINPETADDCFQPLFAVLGEFAKRVNTIDLPQYSSRLLQAELDLFPDWYLAQHKHQPFSLTEQLDWEQLCNTLIQSARAQQQVFVHRDFHSCNLLKTTNNNPGIIDYQDAVIGPLSYDLVSLLWDRYITWPRERITGWCEQFRQQLELDISAEEWQRQCDFMSLQRNLKIVGIFARLHYRDHKSGYLELIPRFIDYCLDILQRYPEFETVLTALNSRRKSDC
ncbi:MAG: phosphotransferase [Xanthomonadales bacterium]|nr:phosphotransferase [Xanthomonadales bacterium]